ncbi:hypothetical protein [Thomasclavelia spiroformis]|uniref:hypothetical protein n=1 Tax=Thomasclavelia spiroformis TaxID=29348 RepID=UPI0029420C69|nr:hypothetical protein [Thomasclavelia spiroformis]
MIKEQLNELLNNMKKHSTVLDTLKQEYETKIKNLEETYKNPTLSNKIFEAEQEYKHTLLNLKDNNIKNVEKVFNSIKEQINKVVSKDVPADFINTIQFIDILGEKISAHEIEIYINKYKDNYMAIRGVLNILNKNNKKKDIEVISLDEVLDNIQQVYNEVTNFFNNGHETYQAFVLTSANGPIQELSNYLDDFLSGHFIKNVIQGIIGDE